MISRPPTVVVLWLGLLSQSVLGQSTVIRRETTAVQSSPAATRLLGTILDLAAREDWPRVLTQLDELQARYDDDLIEVDSRRVLRGGQAAQVLLSQLPPQVLPSQRPGRDLALSAAIDAARLTEDRHARRQLLKRAAGSELAAVLVNDLAESSWRAGRLDEAAAWWHTLRADAVAQPIDPAGSLAYRSTRLSAAELNARDVLVELLRGDRVRAHTMLRAFQKLHPDETGALAGRDGRLADILRDLWNEENDGPPCSDGLPRSDRNDDIRCTVTIGGPMWRLRLTDDRSAKRLTSRPMLSGLDQPEVLPTIADGRIYWATETAVRAVRMDGQPVWPVGPELRDDLLYPSAAVASRELEFPLVGQPCRSVSVDSGRLFALLGDPVAVAAERESRQLESQLVCLDVEVGEGKLLWTTSLQDLFTEPGWRLSGTMLATDGQVIVAARRSRPSQGVALAAFSAETGAPLWFQQVAGILAEPPATWHLTASDTLLADEDQVYLTSGAGLTAALDRRSGRLQWVLQDDPLPWQVPSLTPTGEPARQAAVLSRGLLYTLQHDGQTVQCLETATGTTRWRQRLPSRVNHLLGVRCGVLSTVGQQAWGLDQDTGAVRWRTGYDDVAGEFVGRGQLVGQTLLVCNHEELWEINLPTGEIRNRHPLWAAYGVHGGHVLPGPGRLVIASEEELVALRATEP